MWILGSSPHRDSGTVARADAHSDLGGDTIRPFKAEADAKKAKAAYEQGNAPSGAATGRAPIPTIPTPRTGRPPTASMLLRREIARSRVVQSKMDEAERDAISGRLDDARS